MAVFQDIYERYAQDVYRFALYLSGNEALAEDITSETFVRLWASDEKMIRMLTVKAYLFAIARHLYIDSRQSVARHVEIDPQLPQTGDNPETHAILRSELRDVMKRQDAPQAPPFWYVVQNLRLRGAVCWIAAQAALHKPIGIQMKSFGKPALRPKPRVS